MHPCDGMRYSHPNYLEASGAIGPIHIRDRRWFIFADRSLTTDVCICCNARTCFLFFCISPSSSPAVRICIQIDPMRLRYALIKRHMCAHVIWQQLTRDELYVCLSAADPKRLFMRGWGSQWQLFSLLDSMSLVMESGAIQVRDAAPPLGWTNIVCTQHTGVDVKMQDIHEYTSAFRWHVVVAAVWAVGLPP